jgi:hypothetical protein
MHLTPEGVLKTSTVAPEGWRDSAVPQLCAQLNLILPCSEGWDMSPSFLCSTQLEYSLFLAHRRCSAKKNWNLRTQPVFQRPGILSCGAKPRGVDEGYRKCANGSDVPLPWASWWCRGKPKLSTQSVLGDIVGRELHWVAVMLTVAEKCWWR